MENVHNPIAPSDIDSTYPYEVVRAALLALPLIVDDNSKFLMAQVSELVTLRDPLTFAAAERNILLALDTLIRTSDSPADEGGLAAILAFRLRASRVPLLKATADFIMSEYIGDRAATADRIAQFYREPNYLEILRDFHRRHKDPRPELIRELLRAAGSTPERICDIGCGTADLGVAIAEDIVRETRHPVHVTRLDINSSIVYGASFEHQRSEDVRVTNHCADFFKLWPVPDHSQDLIIITEVLEHSFDPEWLLREAKRVLRANGLVLITVPNAWHWKKVFRFLFYQRLERKFLSDHIQHFSKRTLKELINNEGFDILSVTPFSLHSETPVLFDWEPAQSVERRLHHLYSRIPGCGWNYMAVGRLRRTVEMTEATVVRVSGVMTLGRELLRISKDEAVQQSLSQGGLLLARALQKSQSQGLDTARTVECVLLCTLQRVIGTFKNMRYSTVESWFESIDNSGWSKGILSVREGQHKLVDGTTESEWELVCREAALIWD